MRNTFANFFATLVMPHDNQKKNKMRAVIFARENQFNSNDKQLDELKKYCQANNIEVVQEVIGQVNLALMNFSEDTVILGVDLDFKKDFKYVDEDSLEFLFPSQGKERNLLFCGLHWQYHLFSKGYPQQHRYSSHWLMHILPNASIQKSDIIKRKFDSIINSNSVDAFDGGMALAKMANPSWSIEMLYGFNLLEQLIIRKLGSKKGGAKLYEELYKNASFKKYLNDIKETNPDKWNQYEFALLNMSGIMGENYRNIIAHELFRECTDNSNWKKGKNFDTRFISENSLGCLDKLRNLYCFIQSWEPKTLLMKPKIATPFSASYRVYYEDTDAGGVVYYANYLKFFERARTDFLRALNISQSEFAEKENALFVVRKCEIEYVAPAKLDDMIEVSVEIKETRAASISMYQEITKSGKIISRLHVELVCVFADNFRPKKIPETLKNLFNV